MNRKRKSSPSDFLMLDQRSGEGDPLTDDPSLFRVLGPRLTAMTDAGKVSAPLTFSRF